MVEVVVPEVEQAAEAVVPEAEQAAEAINNPDSTLSSGGFSGDTTTSWDQLAIDEVLAAEEELKFARWKSLTLSWERRAREEDVKDISNVGDVISYVSEILDTPATVDLSAVTQSSIANELGLVFVRCLWTSFKTENSVLRGKKRKLQLLEDDDTHSAEKSVKKMKVIEG